MSTKKETKQSSLIHRRIRAAAFVPVESSFTGRFKNDIRLKSVKYINSKFLSLKTFCNKIIQKPQLWTRDVDFRAIGSDTTVWIVESLIEGFLINFVVWSLMGWRFNFITVPAWGFAIKQLLSIYWRLRKDGENSTIPKKNK